MEMGDGGCGLREDVGPAYRKSPVNLVRGGDGMGIKNDYRGSVSTCKGSWVVPNVRWCPMTDWEGKYLEVFTKRESEIIWTRE